MAIDHEREVETRDVADVAAMIHFVRAHDRGQLDAAAGINATDLPENTPTWVDEAAIINTEMDNIIDETATPAEQVDTAITESDTVEDVRQILDDHPAAADYLHDIVQTDRDEFVTSAADARENNRTYQKARAAANRSPTVRERVRGLLPARLGGTNGTADETDVDPAEQVDGPLRPADRHPAITTQTAAGHRRLGMTPEDYQLAAEETADTAVESAQNVGELCWGLRDTPGAHKDCVNALQTPNAHETPINPTLAQAGMGHNEELRNSDDDPSTSPPSPSP
jgi:hypothetical protein